MVRHYAPPSCASRESLFALCAANRYRWRVMEPAKPPSPSPQRERGAKRDPQSSQVISSSSGSIQLGSFPSVQSSDIVREQTQLITASPPEEHIISAPIMGSLLAEMMGQHQQVQGPAPSPPPPTAQSASPVPQEEELEEKECFPMGCRQMTHYENGWLDIACGPTISIEIEYCSHAHSPKAGQHTPLLPNLLHVDIDAPTVLLRVFGSLARDLLGLKENYPGEYIKMTTFHSNMPAAPPTSQPCPPHLKEATPPEPYSGQDEPAERTMDIFVSFKLQHITAEFPTVRAIMHALLSAIVGSFLYPRTSLSTTPRISPCHPYVLRYSV